MGEAAQRIVRGEKLPIPENCPEALRDIMKKSWEINPANRPEFTEICDMLQHLENAKARRLVSEKRMSRLGNDFRKSQSHSYLLSTVVKDVFTQPVEPAVELETMDNNETLYANEHPVQRPPTTQYSLPIDFHQQE